jgi:hypothetical protein
MLQLGVRNSWIARVFYTAIYNMASSVAVSSFLPPVRVITL